MDHIHFQDHVVIHKICQCILVRHDSANLGSCQKNVLWLFLGKKFFYLLLPAKIKFFMGTDVYKRQATSVSVEE